MYFIAGLITYIFRTKKINQPVKQINADLIKNC